MYLSKIMISGAVCRNPYEVHRALWKLFPPNSDTERDFLFRVERAGQQNAEVLMQSMREPVAATVREARLLASKPYPFSLKQGQRLRFKLLANPVKTISDEDGRLNAEGTIKKCRVPLIRDEELQAWLVRKLAGKAEIESVEMEKRQTMNFYKGRERRVGKIQPVCFQGVLAIADPQELGLLIKSGIGPGKAFGCGMLSLAGC
jgi:CRISPR system Cascade subunit CasE